MMPLRAMRVNLTTTTSRRMTKSESISTVKGPKRKRSATRAIRRAIRVPTAKSTGLINKSKS